PGVPISVEEALVRALASEPEERHPSTAAFGAALRQGDDGTARSQGISEASPGRTPFVGRPKERADLTARLDQLARGVGGLVLIGGEPGVGKTRLAEWVLAEARSRRALALIGHCIEMEGASAPFQPFVEQLEAVVRIAPPGRLRQTLGDSGADLTRLFPRLK